MSDVEGWFKRQQETERQKQELTRIGFPDIDAQRESWARSMKPGERQAVTPETPLLVYPRPGHESDVEFCVVAEGKHYSRSLTPRHARQMARQLLQYADEAER